MESKTITSLDDLFGITEKKLNKNEKEKTDKDRSEGHVVDHESAEDIDENLSAEDMLKAVTLKAFFNYVDVSVGLENTVLSEIERDRFPCNNLADYYFGTKDHKDLIDKVPTLGRKSSRALDIIIEQLVEGGDRLRTIYSSISGNDNKENKNARLSQAISEDYILKTFFKISLIDFVENVDVTVRTINSIVSNPEDVKKYFPALGDYYNAGDSKQRNILKIPNFGKGSKLNLDDKINAVISDKNRLLYILNRLGVKLKYISETRTDKNKSESSINLLIDIEQKIRQVLKKREFDVLALRLDSLRTLEEVGVVYDVTRERIRQIESKAVKKLNVSLMPEIDAFNNRLSSILSESIGAIDYQVVLDGWPEMDNISFRFMLYALERNKNSIFVLEEGIIWQRKVYMEKDEFYRQIDSAFLSSSWPVKISSMEMQLPNTPIVLIKRRLKSRYEAKIDNDIVESVNKLTLGQQARFALRALGGTSHHTGIYEKMRKLFDTKANPHALEADLGRGLDVLIVDRGTYALYESFWLDENDIQEIMNDGYRYLAQKGEYTRVYQIFDDVFKGREFSGREINPYIVLGVLQDDEERFTTKPGLLIGLSHFGDTYQISDVIRSIVREHGPIHIEDVAKLLPENRRVNNETISTCLLGDEDLVRQKSNTYDTVDRVLGSRDVLDRLLADIRYQLEHKELKSKVIYKKIVKEKYPKLTEYALRVLLRRHFKKNKETGYFYAN